MELLARITVWNGLTVYDNVKALQSFPAETPLSSPFRQSDRRGRSLWAICVIEVQR
jgi:hypothetical protein